MISNSDNFYRPFEAVLHRVTRASGSNRTVKNGGVPPTRSLARKLKTGAGKE